MDAPSTAPVVGPNAAPSAPLTPPTPDQPAPAAPTPPPAPTPAMPVIGQPTAPIAPQPADLLRQLAQMAPPTNPPPNQDADAVAQAVAGDGPALPNNAGRTAHRIAMAAGNPGMPIPSDLTAGGLRPQLTGTTDRTRELLTAPSAGDIATRLVRSDDPRSAIAAGSVIASLAQRLNTTDPNPADPDGVQAAAWDLARADYAFSNGLIGNTGDGAEFNRLYRTLTTQPTRLSADDVSRLTDMLSSFANATQGIVGPELKDGNLSVARVDFTSAGAVVRLNGEGHEAGLTRQVAASAPVPSAALASLSDKPSFLHTPDGIAVATAPGSDPAAAADALRVLHPINVNGAQRWIPRAAIDRLDGVNQLANRLMTGSVDGNGDLGPSVVEIHHAPTGPHPATVPGNSIVVTVPNVHVAADARHAVTEFGIDATQTRDLLGVERHDVNAAGDVNTTGTRQLAVTLPDNMTPTDARNVAGALKLAGATQPVLYTHQATDDWAPVIEHHYTGPAGQTIIHRSAADADPSTQHAYQAWMMAADAKKLSAMPSAVNTGANAFAEAPSPQQDGSYVANNELRLKVGTPQPDSKIAMPNQWWNTKVDGQPVRFFVLDHPQGDLPTVSIAATPDDARNVAAAPNAIEGMLNGRTVAELHVPADAGKPDLDTLYRAVRTLTRYGVNVPPNNVRVVGSDGQNYTMTGETK